MIFHCLNGGRLLVYEFFTTDYDELLRTWVIALSAVYLVLLGSLMVLGDQAQQLMDAGKLGNKTKGGFYKKEKINGTLIRYVWDIAKSDYVTLDSIELSAF